MRSPQTGPSGIKKLLPHRHPILLIDRITDLVPGERLTALKAVTCDEPWYGGLPDDADDEAYTYPAALLLESWCQSAAALMAAGEPDAEARAAGVLLFGGMSGVRFTGAVRPGDAVVHQARVTRAFDDTVAFEGESRVDGATVLEVGQVMIARRPADSADSADPAGAVAPAGQGRSRA
ncbi:beta-hydroxyacyl-ACP dehydratase [Streptomyces sp. NBC_01795]|uniref:3-hydroxyacyl-ACP dehydratase FabZ family protein n=1 Tax=unclassified Streptomyces TaxID=2593676 RepID=UPI002DDABCCB|nr:MULTISPECIES: beta-hydroxyacyl-ACP dehydratase [unclassified Streptomyces]WSA90498.1 beta-hydroxyacyl-ACP dehydratase [Streptomyces sp. NBC_01795]WSS16894.1 beta-hydroxyacyl-ACP dehydratase [Streptomyces sp. NBC_01186]